MRKIIAVILAVLSIFLLGCNKTKVVKPAENIEPKIEKEEYVKIITTNKLAYYMIKDIVKDKHSVDYMLKTEEDQWRFEFTEDSLGNISRKDLFIYLGGGYEPWVNKFLEEIKKGKVGIVNASRGIRLLTLTKAQKYKDIEIKENPYYWLNPDDYKIALSNIKNSIQERDPKNREFYENNFNDSVKEIDNYLKSVKALTDDLKKYTFVTSGDRLDYFAKFYNLKVIKIDEYLSSTQEQDKLDKKLAETKNIIYLYDKDERLAKNTEIINKYKMTPIKLLVYKFDMKYMDILKYNFDTLKVYLPDPL